MGAESGAIFFRQEEAFPCVGGSAAFLDLDASSLSDEDFDRLSEMIEEARKEGE